MTRWTSQQLYILCVIWWVHSPHITDDGVRYQFWMECRERNVSLKGKRKNDILHKIKNCYRLNLHDDAPHCSQLHKQIFAHVKKQCDGTH